MSRRSFHRGNYGGRGHDAVAVAVLCSALTLAVLVLALVLADLVRVIL